MSMVRGTSLTRYGTDGRRGPGGAPKPPHPTNPIENIVNFIRHLFGSLFGSHGTSGHTDAKAGAAHITHHAGGGGPRRL